MACALGAHRHCHLPAPQIRSRRLPDHHHLDLGHPRLPQLPARPLAQPSLPLPRVRHQAPGQHLLCRAPQRMQGQPQTDCRLPKTMPPPPLHQRRDQSSPSHQPHQPRSHPEFQSDPNCAARPVFPGVSLCAWAFALLAPLLPPWLPHRLFLQPSELHDPQPVSDNNPDEFQKKLKTRGDFRRSPQKQLATRVQPASLLPNIYCLLFAVYFVIQSQIPQLCFRPPPPHGFLPRVWHR